MPSDHDSDAREAGKATGEPRVSDAPGTPTNTPLDVVKPLVFADNDGWRHAVLDTEWMAWVCPHAHATANEAERCRETDGRVPTKVPEGLTPEEVQDFLSIPYESDLKRATWRCGWLVPQRRRRHAAGVVDEPVAVAKDEGGGDGHHVRPDAVATSSAGAAVGGPASPPSTVKRRQSPGTPRRSWTPRSAKRRPEPAT